MTEFKTPTQVWRALAEVPPGSARAIILNEGQNRQLILNSGSFVIFSKGDILPSSISAEEKLAPVQILQTQRIRTLPKGEVIMDGKGTFGGMSERTVMDQKLTATIKVNLADLQGKTIDEFLASDALRVQIEQMVANKDDLKLDAGGRVVLTTDLSDIALATAARESIEELVEIMALNDIVNKLHIDRQPLRDVFTRAYMTPIPLENVRDDNYVVNIWNGDLKKQAFAVTPFGHMTTLDNDVFTTLSLTGGAKMREGMALFENPETRQQLKGREILGVESVRLFDALKGWGKLSPDGSRDLSNDYRYPHEWIGVWRKAQTALGLDEASDMDINARGAKMIALADEVQKSIIRGAAENDEMPYALDIIGALTIMNGGVNDHAQIEKFDVSFELPAGTFQKMHEAAQRALITNYNMTGIEPGL